MKYRLQTATTLETKLGSTGSPCENAISSLSQTKQQSWDTHRPATYSYEASAADQAPHQLCSLPTLPPGCHCPGLHGQILQHHQSLATSTNISHQNDPIIGPMMVVLPKLVFPLLGGCFWDGPCLSPHSSLWATSPIFKCLSSVKHGMQASIAAGSVAAQRLQKLCTISGVGNAAASLLCKCCASTLSGNVAVQRLQELCNQWCGQCCSPPPMQMLCQHFVWQCGSPKAAEALQSVVWAVLQPPSYANVAPALCLAMWQPKGCRTFAISGVGSVAATLQCKCCAITLSGNVAVQRLQKLCNQWCGQCCSPPPMQMLCQHFVWQCGSPKAAEALQSVVWAVLQPPSNANVVPALCLAMWHSKGSRSFAIRGVGSVAAPLQCKCCASTLSGNVAVQRLQKLCNQWCVQCCSPPAMQNLWKHFPWQALVWILHFLVFMHANSFPPSCLWPAPCGVGICHTSPALDSQISRSMHCCQCLPSPNSTALAFIGFFGPLPHSSIAGK